MIYNTSPNTTQVLLSEEFDGDSIKLLPDESFTLEQFGIDISSDYGRLFEQLIGKQPIFEEFCKEVQRELSSSTKENNASSVEMILWLFFKINFEINLNPKIYHKNNYVNIFIFFLFLIF
jgi:hypothetical protein